MRSVSMVQVKLAGRRVRVAGGVGRAHLEGVRAVGEAAVVGCGDVHGSERRHRPRWHSKVEPGWSAVKEKLDAGVAFVGSSGCAVIDVSGATVSTANARVSGAWTLPAVSVARTRIV